MSSDRSVGQVQASCRCTLIFGCATLVAAQANGDPEFVFLGTLGGEAIQVAESWSNTIEKVLFQDSNSLIKKNDHSEMKMLDKITVSVLKQLNDRSSTDSAALEQKANYTTRDTGNNNEF